MPTLPQIDVQDAVIDDFRGPWLRPQTTDVPASEALLSINAEYNPHNVGTRFGFNAFWAAGVVITTLYNWIKDPDTFSAAGNYLIYYDATTAAIAWVANLLAPVALVLHSVIAEGISVATAGNQLIIASFKVVAGSGAAPSVIGADQCQVVGVFPFAEFTDPAFLGPLTTKPLLANSGTPGVVTPGLHSVGYIITSRNGFLGRPSPVDVGTGLFDTTSNIVSPGGQAINFQITANWPVGAEGIQIVYSPASNPFQYFIVPGLNFAVPSGSSSTVNAQINISDPLLIATAQDVTNNQFLLTADPNGGSGPFNPFKVVEYGARMCYFTLDSNSIPSVYVSDPADYQHITEQYNKLKLPGYRQIMSGFVLRGILYVLGPDWTYGFQDTEGQPATWPSPTLVDGTIGTPCTLGTVVNASNDWAAIVADTGLYIFNGQYQERPLSYMLDEDWRRINWAAAQTIRIADNKDKKQILVTVPLDGATTPSHIMQFDYTDGLSYDTVKYSLWNIAGVAPRGLVVFQNPSTARMENLVSPGAPGEQVLRQMNDTDDADPYFDHSALHGDSAIAFQWECAPQPDGSIGQIMAAVGGYVRAIGSGTLSATAYSLDRAKSASWAKPIVLAKAPGVEYFRQFYMTSERTSVRFTCGVAVGDYVVLSGYRQRYYPWALRR